jgi:malonate-semialdehyde dehydrogenase (acetylating)/methylmalonate-semialdehyde dehydrogenase
MTQMSAAATSAPHRVQHHIDGARVAGASGRTAPLHDPATGAEVGRVDLASAAEVDAAVAAAAAAFPAWRRTSLAARTSILFAFRQLLDAHRRELAALVTAEHGKVADDAAGEVARGIENVEFACGFAAQLKGESSEQVAGGVDVVSIRQPLGVVAGITPFNFPAMVPLWMLPAAIAAGNTFVLKPSERDPSPSLLIADLLAEAGLPPGVVNVVQGDKEAVDRLVEHPDVAAVSFVGSTPVARAVHRAATAHGKRVQALGGAKNHLVVLPDADLDAAADAAVSAAFGSAGERCMAVSVVVAVGGVGDALVAAVADRMGKLVVGPATDAASQMGPLISREHRDRVAGAVGVAQHEGATVVVDGRTQAFEGDGFFLGASLVDHVTPDMAVYRDEVFGPVLAVVRVDGFDEAVRLVNEHPYGNGAALFTRDGGSARAFQFEVEAGMVGINVAIPVPVASYSFGGWKGSLFGDLHMYGPDSVRFFTRTKVVTTRWPDASPGSPAGGVDLGFPRSA